MAEITREYIAEKRAFLESQIITLQGAMEMLKVIEDELLPKDAMTMDELKDALGAVEIGEPEPLKGGE